MIALVGLNFTPGVLDRTMLSQPLYSPAEISASRLVAKDKLAPKSQFFGGVNYIEMSVDSQLVFKQAIEKVNIAESRAIYTLMDFKTMRSKGTRFYKLYIEDGNDLKFYEGSPGSGKIKVNPKKISSVRIKMRDSDGNASAVMFKLKPSKPEKEVNTLEAYSGDIGYDITENTMMVVAKPCKESSNKATVYAGEGSYEIEPDYYNYNRSVYLIDLRKIHPRLNRSMRRVSGSQN